MTRTTRGIPLPPSSLEIELPLSSTWRRPDASGTAPKPTPSAPRPAPTPPAPAPITTRPSVPPSVAVPTPAAKPAAPTAAPRSAPVLGQTTCPKCGAVQRPAKACARCGLVFANWRSDSAPAASDIPETLRLSLDKLFEEATRPTAEFELREARLERFHDVAREGGALAYAGDTYRRWMLVHPDDAFVEKLRQRVLLEAMQSFEVRPDRTVKSEIGRRGLILGLAAGLVLTALSTWFFLRLLQR